MSTHRFEFEWRISDPDEDGKVYVLERLAGTDKKNEYGPMPSSVAESFIKARRAFVHRTITTRTGAMQVFDPRPKLIGLAAAQAKMRRARHDA